MKRILLKLSGEALAGEKKTGFDEETVRKVALQVKELVDDGIQVGIVIGGGNFWRGRSSENIDRTKADQIGMLATIMNCIYVSEIFRSVGMMTNILTPFECGSFTKLFSKDRANKYFAKGMVVFFAGGTGHPYFSTDTGVVLRAIEVEAEVILLAKAIDGVYNADPAKDPTAKKYDEVSIDEVIAKNLQVVDMTASILARDNKMPMWVFGLNEENSIVNTLKGKFNGTKVTVYQKSFAGVLEKLAQQYDYTGAISVLKNNWKFATSDKMQKAFEFLEADFAAIRAGRANPHVLDKLRVDYYGTPTPIQQVGNVTVPEARIIQIAPWEKSLIKEIEKAIMTSDIGINPSNDGSVIRLVFPELTEERRKDLVKEVKKKGEEGKVAIRNIRRDGNDAFKKLAKTEVSEDEIKGLEDDLQKLTDKYVKDIDALIDSKSKEIMTV